MLKEITIKNFKSHQNTKLLLNNLNILVGLNGTGKSSIIQSLLLLRQSFQHNGLQKGIQLNKPLVKIGLGQDALYQFAKEDSIEFIIKKADGQDLIWKMKVSDGDLDSTFLSFKNNAVNELEEISLLNENFQYLSAERLAPQESYEKDDYAVEIERQLSKEGGKGELIAHFLSYYGKKSKVDSAMLLHPKELSNDLLSQTNAWLKEISPNVNVEITDNSKYFEVKYNFDVEGDFPTNDFRAENVGFGITYSLPIIVALLSAKKNSLIIIENPEAHIHPSGQSKLAELISIAAQCGIQVIIETHSDHIINGVLVATKKFEEEKKGINFNNVNVYLFTRSEKGHTSEIQSISVLSEGRIKSPPKGFFDQISQDRKYLRGF